MKGSRSRHDRFTAVNGKPGLCVEKAIRARNASSLCTSRGYDWWTVSACR